MAGTSGGTRRDSIAARRDMTYSLRTRSGRNGYYFQRAVPKALQGQLGKVLQCKAADTHADALRRSQELLLSCERVFSLCESDKSVRFRSFRDYLITVESGHDVSEIVSESIIKVTESINDENSRYDKDAAGLHHIADIIDYILFKDPNKSHNTLEHYRGTIKRWLTHTGVRHFEHVTRDHCKLFIQKHAEYCRNKGNRQSTFTTHCDFVSAMFALAYEAEWVKDNPFKGLKYHTIKIENKQRGEARVDKKIDVSIVDEFFSIDKYGLSEARHLKSRKMWDQYIVTWWIMRYCLCHVSEAEGVMWEDIDLSNKTIWIRANAIRDLKTSYRPRQIPMLEPLHRVLSLHQRKTKQTKGNIFGIAEGTTRFGANIQNYIKKVGDYTPKDAKDASNSVIQSMWKGNQRVILELNGHGFKEQKTETHKYGSITMETKLECLSLLMR